MKISALIALFLFAPFYQWKLHSTADYEISYPPEWELRANGFAGMDFYIFLDLTGPEDKFAENVNLTTEDISGLEMDLPKYVELSELGLGRTLDSLKILRSEQLEDAQGPYHELIYDGQVMNFPLRWKQHIRLRDDKAWILAFVAEQSTYDSLAETADGMMKSFRLLDSDE